MSLDVVIGPMFSGKSSYVLSVISRYSALGVPVLVITHESDTRYGQGFVATHDGRNAPCIHTRDLDSVDIAAYKVIIVDEAQFFKHLVPFVEWAVDTHHKHVYLVGLDGDSNRRKFGEILDCIPLADRVLRLTSFCRRCADGTPGLFSYRREYSDQQVIVGGSNQYETLCRDCYLFRTVSPV
jgi:thymidine kinase